MVCRDFILPEPASYVFFYAIFNLRNLLYIIMKEQWKKEIAQQDKSTIPVITNIENCLQRVTNQQTRPGGDI